MRWLFVVLAVATLALAASCGGDDDSPSPSTGGELTADQVQKLTDIVQADPAVAEILGQSPSTLTDFRPWIVGTVPDTGEEIFAGGLATMVLSERVGHLELNLMVPQIRTYYTSWSAEDRAKYTPYRSTLGKFAVDNFSRVQLSVDLEREKLAGMRVLSDQEHGQRVAAMTVQPVPQFTAGISQAAKDIISADTRLAGLLQGRGHETTEGSTYTIGNAHFAANAVHLDEVQALEADWLILFDIDPSTGIYASQTVHFKAAEVASISVVVDLDKGAIAWLEPIKLNTDPTPIPRIDLSPVPTAAP